MVFLERAHAFTKKTVTSCFSTVRKYKHMPSQKKKRETSMCIKVIGDKWVRLCGMNWRCPAREACVAAQCRHESTLPLLFFIFLK
jgi:hypothetical protein